jgi:hypothetical protein
MAVSNTAMMGRFILDLLHQPVATGVADTGILKVDCACRRFEPKHAPNKKP